MKRPAALRAVRGSARLRTIAVGTLLLASCATTAVGENSAEHTVAVTTYTVPMPEGEGWEVTRDRASEKVSFQRKSVALGSLVASSSLKVLTVPFCEEGAAMSEETLADGYLEREHQGMLVLGVARDMYRLGEVRKAVETVGGRKVYTMRYTTEPSNPGVPTNKCEAALFLYVPPDYAARRAFYAFHVQECRATNLLGRMVSTDLGRIQPVIAGFTLRASTPHPAPRQEVWHPDANHLACPDVGGGASAAERKVRWGMTVDEVVAALPGEAVRASPAEIEKGVGPVRIDACEFAGTTFEATFLFHRASRLTQIALAPASAHNAARPLFDRLAKMLTERYGRPATDVPDQSMGMAGLRGTQKSWGAADARIVLSYMYGAGDPFLELSYQEPARPDADRN